MTRRQRKPPSPEGRPPTASAVNPGEQLVSTRMEGAVRAWQPHWQHFLKSHPAWGNCAPPCDPVYGLPEEVVNHLAPTVNGAGRRQRTSPVFLTSAEAEVERAFRECCLEFSPWSSARRLSASPSAARSMATWPPPAPPPTRWSTPSTRAAP